jgi:cation:H+ antiporter
MVLTPDLLTSLAIVVVSLYTLVTAAERAVSSSLTVARHFGVPDVLVGMTVLALGTSLPELGSNVVASVGIATGSLDYEITSAVVVGGNVGSATVQQLLLVGVLVLGYGRIDVTDSFLRESYLPMVAALALTLALAWDGTLSRVDGGVLLVAYLAYAGHSYRTRERQMALPTGEQGSVRREAVVAVGALVLVLASASLLLWVIGSVVAALELGGSMVGVLTIGVAAALPELSTVLDATRRRTPTVALGVLVGSNLVNFLVGLGLGASISGYHVPAPVVLWDVPFKLVAALALFAYLRLGSDRALTRREGSYLVVAYLVYLSGRLLVFTTA